MRQLTRAVISRKKRAITGALFCLALAISPAWAGPAEVSPNAKQIAAYEAADEATRVRLLITLAKNGQHDIAEIMLHRYPLQGPPAANRTLFINGLILKGRGNQEAAVDLYRKALADDPSLTLVRAELAETLAAMGETDSAKHQMKRLLSEASTEEEAQGMRAFIDQLDSDRPLTFNSYFGVVPSSNVNLGSDFEKVYDWTSQAPITIGDGITLLPELNTVDNPKESGLGMKAGGRVGYTRNLGERYAIVAGLGADGRIYKNDKYNSLGISQSLELRYLTDNGFIGVGAVGSQGIQKRVPYKTVIPRISDYTVGPRVSFQNQVTPADRLNFSAVHEWRRNFDSKAFDGYTTRIDGSLDHSFSTDLGISIAAAFENFQTGYDDQSYQAWIGGVTLYKELPFGITATLQGEIRAAHFDDVFDANNPDFNIVRDDKQYAASVNLVKRDWSIWGYAPSLTYSYAINRSNIDLYDLDSHTVDLTFTKDF